MTSEAIDKQLKAALLKSQPQLVRDDLDRAVANLISYVDFVNAFHARLVADPERYA